MTIATDTLRRGLAAVGLAMVLGLSVVTLSLPATIVRADDVDPAVAEDAARSRSTSFQAVSGAQQEDVPGGPLLVAAYGAVLVLVLGYVLYLGSLTSGASRDLERLERAIEAKKPDFRTSARGDAIASEILEARDGGEGASKDA